MGAKKDQPQRVDALSIQTAALSLADVLADTFGLLDKPLMAPEFVALARRRTGLGDFGDTQFAGPLRRLLSACSAESDLSLVGRMATKWDIVRFLSNLLRLRAAEVARPGILSEPIDRPIFITGLPRSGTTFLHRLMLTDPANRAPLVWETIYPYPNGIGSSEQRIARVARQLRTFEVLAPEFRALHPLDARSPQECSEIAAHVFRSLRFDTNYHIPSYRTWMDADVERHLPAYRFHRRFLQHLQSQDRATRQPGRWVLKCPEHLFALQALRTVYPDAKLIFVHRDPLRVLVSQARLTEVLRRPFTRGVNRTQIGRDESTRWLDGTRRMMEVGDDAGLPDPVCHVHHIDLIADPVATVDAVYRHFGEQMPAAAAAGIEQYVKAHPNGGYGRHEYRATDYGLDPEKAQTRFRPYMLRFGIVAERADPPPRGGPREQTPTQAIAPL
jgi:hypothetical protein